MVIKKVNIYFRESPKHTENAADKMSFEARPKLMAIMYLGGHSNDHQVK